MTVYKQISFLLRIHLNRRILIFVLDRLQRISYNGWIIKKFATPHPMKVHEFANKRCR